ncbi:glycoside hydrolase [Pseudorhodobacter sp. E13]|uniref:glycoside hydrolase family 25 protein n=1 Tax=Pseudorhodobacter sp. E13 TaxID=2487931 RepID=UPI000F8EF06F|nr:GH25 family lysozyme [Pseudorhodobacter sp. E13]RUS60955.1 glycoside hydrolase [Pseudorhodobacter sp. E13]
MVRLGLGVLVLAMTLAACGGREHRQRGPHAGQQAAVQLPANAPRFGDAKPHEWDGRAPSAYAVHGIDASRWQGEIDWATAIENGVSFAFFKATEGGDVIDPAFDDYWKGAGRAGLPRGAYHFYYFCRPAIEQARWFIRNVPRERGALPPVLDMEWNAHSPTCTKRPDAAHVRSEAKIFMDALERHYGQRPIIYTTVDFFAENQLGRLAGYDFWLRSVAGHPSKVYPGQAWTFWQYSGTGLVPGISGKVDLNTFAGSRADWRAWAQRRMR